MREMGISGKFIYDEIVKAQKRYDEARKGVEVAQGFAKDLLIGYVEEERLKLQKLQNAQYHGI